MALKAKAKILAQQLKAMSSSNRSLRVNSMQHLRSVIVYTAKERNVSNLSTEKY